MISTLHKHWIEWRSLAGWIEKNNVRAKGVCIKGNSRQQCGHSLSVVRSVKLWPFPARRVWWSGRAGQCAGEGKLESWKPGGLNSNSSLERHKPALPLPAAPGPSWLSPLPEMLLLQIPTGLPPWLSSCLCPNATFSVRPPCSARYLKVQHHPAALLIPVLRSVYLLLSTQHLPTPDINQLTHHARGLPLVAGTHAS